MEYWEKWCAQFSEQAYGNNIHVKKILSAGAKRTFCKKLTYKIKRLTLQFL
jgi:hypothetical protein